LTAVRTTSARVVAVFAGQPFPRSDRDHETLAKSRSVTPPDGEHLSSSRVQQEAEAQILAALAVQEKITGLAPKPRSVTLSGDVQVEADGYAG